MPVKCSFLSIPLEWGPGELTPEHFQKAETENVSTKGYTQTRGDLCIKGRGARRLFPVRAARDCANYTSESAENPAQEGTAGCLKHRATPTCP